MTRINPVGGPPSFEGPSPIRSTEPPKKLELPDQDITVENVEAGPLLGELTNFPSINGQKLIGQLLSDAFEKVPEKPTE